MENGHRVIRMGSFFPATFVMSDGEECMGGGCVCTFTSFAGGIGRNGRSEVVCLYNTCVSVCSP